MTNLQSIIDKQPYSLEKNKKNKLFKSFLSDLNYHHYKYCKKYKKIIQNLNFDLKKKDELINFPMLPVSIFKSHDLFSVNKSKIVKKIYSSGTSSKNLSKIFLDKINSNNQMKVLSKILETLIGRKRLPMIIMDKDPRLNSKLHFNAKSAAILGFSLFGRDHCYVLDNNKNINFNLLNAFLKKYQKQKFIVFGFTSSIYEYLINNSVIKLPLYNFKNAILLHGGGWKKLEKFKINNKEFKKKLNKKLGIKNTYNYYGLVEQTGSIFLEGRNCGYFHASNFSEIIIRDKNFNVQKKGKRGLIQLISLLPSSYPGHNILTEDIGELKGEDDCKCGLKGKYFLVHGRVKEAEIRGCSDVK